MDCIVSLVIGLALGAVGGGSVIIYWWRADRKEVDAHVADMEHNLRVYKNTYFITKHLVKMPFDEDVMGEFGTFDGGLNWYWVKVHSNGGIQIHDQLDPVLDEALFHELCERIVVANGQAPSREEKTAGILDV